MRVGVTGLEADRDDEGSFGFVNSSRFNQGVPKIVISIRKAGTEGDSRLQMVDGFVKPALSYQRRPEIELALGKSGREPGTGEIILQALAARPESDRAVPKPSYAR